MKAVRGLCGWLICVGAFSAAAVGVIASTPDSVSAQGGYAPAFRTEHEGIFRPPRSSLNEHIDFVTHHVTCWAKNKLTQTTDYVRYQTAPELQNNKTDASAYDATPRCGQSPEFEFRGRQCKGEQPCSHNNDDLKAEGFNYQGHFDIKVKFRIPSVCIENCEHTNTQPARTSLPNRPGDCLPGYYDGGRHADLTATVERHLERGHHGETSRFFPPGTACDHTHACKGGSRVFSSRSGRETAASKNIRKHFSIDYNPGSVSTRHYASSGHGGYCFHRHCTPQTEAHSKRTAEQEGINALSHRHTLNTVDCDIHPHACNPKDGEAGNDHGYRNFRGVLNPWVLGQTRARHSHVPDCYHQHTCLPADGHVTTAEEALTPFQYSAHDGYCAHYHQANTSCPSPDALLNAHINKFGDAGTESYHGHAADVPFTLDGIQHPSTQVLTTENSPHLSSLAIKKLNERYADWMETVSDNYLRGFKRFFDTYSAALAVTLGGGRVEIVLATARFKTDLVESRLSLPSNRFVVEYKTVAPSIGYSHNRFSRVAIITFSYEDRLSLQTANSLFEYYKTGNINIGYGELTLPPRNVATLGSGWGGAGAIAIPNRDAVKTLLTHWLEVQKHKQKDWRQEIDTSSLSRYTLADTPSTITARSREEYDRYLWPEIPAAAVSLGKNDPLTPPNKFSVGRGEVVEVPVPRGLRPQTTAPAEGEILLQTVTPLTPPPEAVSLPGVSPSQFYWYAGDAEDKPDDCAGHNHRATSIPPGDSGEESIPPRVFVVPS